MRVDTLTLMLQTWDLPGTVEFYKGVLGLKCAVVVIMYAICHYRACLAE